MGGALGTARFRDASLDVRRLDEVQADTGAPRAGLGRRLRTLVEGNVRDRRTYQDQGEHDSVKWERAIFTFCLSRAARFPFSVNARTQGAFGVGTAAVPA